MNETRKALEDVAKILEGAGWNHGLAAHASGPNIGPERESPWRSWLFPAVTTVVVLGLATVLTIAFFFGSTARSPELIAISRKIDAMEKSLETNRDVLAETRAAAGTATKQLEATQQRLRDLNADFVKNTTILFELKRDIEGAHKNVAALVSTELDAREKRIRVGTEKLLAEALKRLDEQIQAEATTRKRQIDDVKKLIAAKLPRSSPTNEKLPANPMEGSWKLVDFQRADRKFSKQEIESARIAYKFKDASFSLQELGESQSIATGRFIETGKRLDLTFLAASGFPGLNEFAKGRKLEGIYELHDDTLRILVAEKVRPTSFDSPRSPDSILLIFHRDVD